jgi:hypothetical protein
MIAILLVLVIIILVYILAVCFCDKCDVPQDFIYGSWINNERDIIIIKEDSISICGLSSDGNYKCSEMDCRIRKKGRFKKFLPVGSSMSFCGSMGGSKLEIESDIETGTISIKKDNKNYGVFAKNTLVNL